MIYGAVFILAFSLPGGSGACCRPRGNGFVSRAVLHASRSLDSQEGSETAAWRPGPGAHTYVLLPLQQPPAATSFARPADDLSTSLTWVSSLAKQNKHRLPADTYVTILETCQMLDSVIDTESRQPSADAGFEYELEAVVSEYLPAVLQGYLAIPPSMVENRQPNGKTPNEELVEQLAAPPRTGRDAACHPPQPNFGGFDHHGKLPERAVRASPTRWIRLRAQVRDHARRCSCFVERGADTSPRCGQSSRTWFVLTVPAASRTDSAPSFGQDSGGSGRKS